MRRKKWGRNALIVVLVLCLIPVYAAAALDKRSGDTIYVPEGEIRGPLFVSGNNITIDANVDGDVFATGQSVVINGDVSGDVIAAVNTASISGSVKGDIRVACNTLNIYGPVDGSVTGAGNTMFIRENSSVKRDVVMFGNTVEILGPVGGEVIGASNQMYLNSNIQGNVTIWDVQNLVVGPAGVIEGNMTYASSNKVQISPDAKVAEVKQLQPERGPVQKTDHNDWMGALWQLASGLLLWGAAALIFPKMLPNTGKTGREAPWASLGIGFLAVVAAPVAALLLMITVIGIPLSFILIFNYIVIIIIAKVVVSDAIGRFMVERFNWSSRGSLFLGVAISLTGLILLSRIPVFGIGFFLSLAVVCLAFGIITVALYRWRKEQANLPEQIETAGE